MKIEYVDKFDLYKMGNYIGSFDSYDEIQKFFEDCIHFSDSVCPPDYNYYKASYRFNEDRYTVIQSKHLNFS